MDVYLVACFIFTFLSLAKLAVVKYMRQKVTKNKEKQKEQEIAEQAQTAMIKELGGASATAIIAPSLSLPKVQEADEPSDAPMDDDEDDDDMIILEEEVVIDKIAISEAVIVDSSMHNGVGPVSDFLVEEVVCDKNLVCEMTALHAPILETVICPMPQFATAVVEKVEQHAAATVIEIPAKEPSLKEESQRTASLRQKRRHKTRFLFKRHPASTTDSQHHDKYWRWMKAFHVISQLIFPLLFVAFGLFYFLIYPYFGQPATCT